MSAVCRCQQDANFIYVYPNADVRIALWCPADRQSAFLDRLRAFMVDPNAGPYFNIDNNNRTQQDMREDGGDNAIFLTGKWAMVRVCTQYAQLRVAVPRSEFAAAIGVAPKR